MREKKETKKVANKGITLIALVITIIVLLILAAVSIATLTGDNGILTKEDTAKKETIEEQEREEVKLAYATAVTDKLSKGDTSNVTTDELNIELSNQNIQATATEGTTEEGAIDVTFSKTEHKYTVHQSGDEKGKITGAEEGEVSEDNSIPMAEAKQKGKFDTKTEVKAEDNKIFPVPAEFKIAVDSANRVEDGVVIEDTREGTAGSQFVWIPIESDGDYVRNITYKETNVSETAKNDEDYLPDALKEKSTKEDKTEGEIEKETVVSAGGFYISRFEAGKEGDNEPYTLVSKKDTTVWANIIQTECKTKAKYFINNADVKSGLITGIQWDMVMNFVNGEQDGYGKTFDVVEYKEENGRQTVSLTKSGQNIADKVCNIYDLEGNFWEYVAEKNDFESHGPYVGRGGGCNTSYDLPASGRVDTYGGANEGNSFRLVLYII